MIPPVLFDTNAISDLMRDHAKIKARVAAHADPLLTSVMVRGEIRYGLERLPVGKKRTDLESRARAILAALTCEPVTEQMAEAYGRIKATLDSQGLNLQDNDLWIGATAMVLGAVLITRDQPLKNIPGLQVDDWTL